MRASPVRRTWIGLGDGGGISVKKKAKLIFIGALAAVTAVTAIRFIADWGRNEPDYSAVEELIEQQRYDEAFKILNALENADYKSADALRDFCRAH